MLPVPRLPDGKYAVPTASGDYRLIWLKTVTGEKGEKDAGLFGRRFLFYKKVKGWQAFAFLNDNGVLQIHIKMLKLLTQQQQDALRQAIAEIRENPERAAALYRDIEKQDKPRKVSR